MFCLWSSSNTIQSLRHREMVTKTRAPQFNISDCKTRQSWSSGLFAIQLWLSCIAPEAFALHENSQYSFRFLLYWSSFAFSVMWHLFAFLKYFFSHPTDRWAVLSSVQSEVLYGFVNLVHASSCQQPVLSSQRRAVACGWAGGRFGLASDRGKWYKNEYRHIVSFWCAIRFGSLCAYVPLQSNRSQTSFLHRRLHVKHEISVFSLRIVW